MATIKLRRGEFSDLPALVLGEIGYCTDTKQYYIGNGISNTWIASPILDEDNLVSDSATSLATQQSIKAYVDNNLIAPIEIKKLSFTAVSGTHYLVSTLTGEIIITLPASPSAGDKVTITDYSGFFGTCNCIINNNSKNIMGEDILIRLPNDNTSITLKYIDATMGWSIIHLLRGDLGTSTDFIFTPFTGPIQTLHTFICFVT